MKRRCPKCGAEWEIKGRIGFREECPECAAFLHTCVNCMHYEPQSIGCRILTTDSVRDRQSVNFCEEFEFNPNPSANAARGGAPPGTSGEDARRRFDDLFRDSKG